jgi:signal transduction histidine kinase
MQERANGFGGILHVKSAPQEGTVISVTLKVPEKAQ